MSAHRLSLVAGEETLFAQPGIVLPNLGLSDIYGKTRAKLERIIPLRSRFELQTLVSESQQVLARATTVFPLDLFPDSLTIDENKVNIIKRGLFSEQIHSFLIEDVTEVTVNSVWIFATVEVTDSTNPRFPWVFHLTPMWANDAFRLRRILQGAIKAKRQGIDLSIYETREIKKELEKLGEATQEEQP